MFFVSFTQQQNKKKKQCIDFFLKTFKDRISKKIVQIRKQFSTKNTDSSQSFCSFKLKQFSILIFQNIFTEHCSESLSDDLSFCSNINRISPCILTFQYYFLNYLLSLDKLLHCTIYKLIINLFIIKRYRCRPIYFRVLREELHLTAMDVIYKILNNFLKYRLVNPTKSINFLRS